MGLDNGVRLISQKKIVFPCWFERVDDCTKYREDDKFEYEVAYWRKCWNVRDRALAALRGEEQGQYEYSMNVEHLRDFINSLQVLLLQGEEGWEESIWDFDEAKYALLDYIKQLTWVADYADEHEDCEIQFYDSY